MKVDLYSNKGLKTSTKVDLDDKVFKVEMKKDLVSFYVYAYLSNQRQANAHTKDRSEVRGGGKKPWRQKGTGRARAGSLRSPIFAGGGVTFGPTNERNYTKKVNKKQKKLALNMALSEKVSEKKLFVIKEFTLGKEKFTKQLEQLLKKMKISEKVLLIDLGVNKELISAAGNLSSVKTSMVDNLNAYEVLNSQVVIFSSDAIAKLNKIDKKVSKSSTKK